MPWFDSRRVCAAFSPVARRQRRWHGILTGLLLVLMPVCLLAAPEPTMGDKVKAAVVVKLTRFVEWPPEAVDAAAPLPLCLFAGSRLAGALESFGPISVQDHPLILLPLYDVSDPRLNQCRIVLIEDMELLPVETVLRAVRSLPVLTVSDLPGFALQGGMIGLVEVDNHLGFEINLSAARRIPIAISARLLELAKIIE